MKSIQDMTPDEARVEFRRLMEASAALERTAQVDRLRRARGLLDGMSGWHDLGIPEGEYYMVLRTLAGWLDKVDAAAEGGTGGDQEQRRKEKGP